MSKKKLTKKRKKQLLAMFMTAGMMTNTFISTGIAFAETNVTNEVGAKSNISGEIPFVLLGEDIEGKRITSISAVNDRLIVKTNGTLQGNYFVYASDSPIFKPDESFDNLYRPIDVVFQNPAEGSGILVSNEKISSYISEKYYYIAAPEDGEFGLPLARINGTDLGKNVDVDDESSLTAHNAFVEYGSTWNDSVAKQVTGVKATDKYGNDVTNNVTVSGSVDTNKPGNYNVTFTSPESGKSITVVITVKDALEENATIEANDFEVDYGFDLTDEAAIEKAGA
ncbi:hypothetical protein UA3_02446, partial [Enterococcus faecium EnGen0263]|uniref:immunoglobulin-like domain-containing protein n=1 Tax=Enterococcus faecium TaxID=1352 RepID=UPI0003306713